MGIISDNISKTNKIKSTYIPVWIFSAALFTRILMISASCSFPSISALMFPIFTILYLNIVLQCFIEQVKTDYLKDKGMFVLGTFFTVFLVLYSSSIFFQNGLTASMTKTICEIQ